MFLLQNSFFHLSYRKNEFIIVKKLLFIFSLLVLSFILSIVLKFDSEVIIYTGNYEIFTNTKFLFFIFSCIAKILFLIVSIYYILTNTSASKIVRKIKKEKNKYDLYLDNIYNAITYSILGDLEKANIYLVKASKIIDNKLTNTVRSQIFLQENKDLKIVKNGELINDNINLSKSICENNVENMEKYANKILNKQKNNIHCLNILYNIHKDNNNWEECLKILKTTKKQFSKNNYNRELVLIYGNLAEKYFINKEYNNSLIYSLKLFNINKTLFNNNTILIQSLDKLNNKKLYKYIEKVWKYTPHKDIGLIYINSQKNKIIGTKKLYKINKKDIKSIVFYCDILIKENSTSLINDDIVEELRKYNYKETYEILLKIEEKEKANSLLINSLREKISKSNKLYK